MTYVGVGGGYRRWPPIPLVWGGDRRWGYVGVDWCWEVRWQMFIITPSPSLIILNHLFPLLNHFHPLCLISLLHDVLLCWDGRLIGRCPPGGSWISLSNPILCISPCFQDYSRIFPFWAFNCLINNDTYKPNLNICQSLTNHCTINMSQVWFQRESSCKYFFILGVWR